jgi:hypothetical protein
MSNDQLENKENELAIRACVGSLALEETSLVDAQFSRISYTE